ncbi:hypothetical protein A2Z23_02710 [Candidatus Curtissbacteria bacterium RBG_16_39_7]|uniref:Uncharacterized protein n=1 Tax=Candidatus Curtissbacteria bacterium RBG_16_39_7 TaxID=1797707 RepID=A0A1F5G1S8_9BACT|nr:MAG: hypothetical protein A2Z23_02710 [Candidatus Curtissbacteria bacterium RBG_16_39_7]
MVDLPYEDFKKLITEIIQKQVVVLGPQIAILKARNVSGLDVANDGTVNKIEGDPKSKLQELINEYVSLSGLIVRQTMEPLLAKYPGLKIAEGKVE